MKDSKKNLFIDFYGKNKISPVRQDISDFKIHLKRREKLYRTVGLPVIAFSNNDILEVGPGGGYNTLCFSIGVQMWTWWNLTLPGTKKW